LRGCGSEIDGEKGVTEGGIGMGSGAGGVAERGDRAEFSKLWGAVSCRSSEPPWGETELDLSSGKSFDTAMALVRSCV